MNLTESSDQLNSTVPPALFSKSPKIGMDPHIRWDLVVGIMVLLVTVVGMWYNLKGEVEQAVVLDEQRYIQQAEHNKFIEDSMAELKDNMLSNRQELNQSLRDLKEDVKNNNNSAIRFRERVVPDPPERTVQNDGTRNTVRGLHGN